MGLEDAASLAECLDRIRDTSHIHQALLAFEAIRKPRTTLVSSLGQRNSNYWQLPDGEEQQRRDEKVKTSGFYASPPWDGKQVDEVPDSIQHPLFNIWLMTHDTIDYVSITAGDFTFNRS
jgi:salicylate hydroxylase